jgi:hypothetical protein
MITNRWWAGVITLGGGPGRHSDRGLRDGQGPSAGGAGGGGTAVNSAVAEASKYVPDQAKSLQAGLATAKEKFSKGDYAAATSEATALAAKAKDVANAAAAKKTELAQTWDGMNAGVTKVVETIKGREDILSQSEKLPANMTADKLATAKSGLGEITQQWTAATEAYKGGNLMERDHEGYRREGEGG